MDEQKKKSLSEISHLFLSEPARQRQPAGCDPSGCPPRCIRALEVSIDLTATERIPPNPSAEAAH